ncbi:asparagine synthetase [Actinomortierella wolfii]|nr:asparagine synthetase [Actinomortierella wolfii]
MCGIFGVYNLPGDASEFRDRALYLSKKLRHRGPDWSGCTVAGNHILCHERLAIVGVESGAQPLTNEDETLILSVNGEIYNHKALRKMVPADTHFKTQSDCEVILHLYKHIGKDVVKHLDGMFSWILLDTKKNRILAARDPIGITTLYQGWNSKQPGTIYFASELKALNEECDRIIAFPPGHIFDSETGETTRYFEPTWWDGNRIPTNPVDYTLIRETLEKAVRKRLMAEVPYGVLLSGGLDSSLIASIAARESRKIFSNQPLNMKDGDDVDESGVQAWPRLHSFSIGLEGSPDLKAARIAADFLKTVHHEYTFTVQDGLDAVADVVYHLETYDVTTIRASTPMYLLSRKIKAMGVKMVLSGEGADEIFGGYLYFHAAPDAASFHQENVMRVKNLHYADCLRANKSTMAWGVEARVPFLDKAFLEVALNINPEEKAAERWPKDTPKTKEAYYYREVFEKWFPQEACTESVVRWIPREDWGCPADPSGRAQKVHDAAYDKTA